MSTLVYPDDPGPGAAWRGPGQLALLLQEVLTATVRLRAGRHATLDARAFRAQIRSLLQGAERDALQAGYSADFVRLAVYAVVALLDEAVLNQQPTLAEWAQKPLQDELFGDSRGGERFFQQLRQLLAVPDSAALADLLEVYQLCLLLGFRGRYAVADGGDLHALRGALTEKIERTRGVATELSPDWRPGPGEGAPARRDPWVRRLAYGAMGAAVASGLLYVAYTRALASDVAVVRTEVQRSADNAAHTARGPQ